MHPSRALAHGITIYEVADASRSALNEFIALDPASTKRVIDAERSEHAFLRDGEDFIDQKNSVEWWTFAGGAANTLLARMFERELGGRCVARNTNISFLEGAETSVAAIRDCLRRWAADDRPSVDDAAQLAPLAARTELSKFEPCMPNAMVAELQSSRTFDCLGAQRLARTLRVSG